MHYWLMKTDPDVYSWRDLLAAPGRRTTWEGVRNFQARNFLRSMREGDLAFWYHSVTMPQAIYGVVRIVREAYADPTQFDPTSRYFDPASQESSPRWVMVEVEEAGAFEPAITLPELRGEVRLEGMELLRRGSRLSIQPVTEREWDIVLSMRESGITKGGKRP